MKKGANENVQKEGIDRVAIIGAGTSGCTAAVLLAEAGVEVTLFDSGERPDLIVGESLLPAMVPTLQRLGIEDDVAKCSVVKPGACFVFPDGGRLGFSFTSVEGLLPTYAYNINRKGFDEVLSRRADRAGIHRVPVRGGVVVAEGDRLELDEASMRAAGGEYAKGRQPDLLIDATGRSRLFARKMKVPTATGARRDIAHFAHFEGYHEECVPSGQVVIGFLESGWSWRIPQPGGRMSIGIVVNKDEARRLGETPEQRLDGVLRNDPLMREHAKKAERVTDVMTYTNYQLISERGSGANWASLGDSFGFVDPMLSPGLLLAMKSAECLADGIVDLRAGKSTLALVCERHEQSMRKDLEAWAEYVERFYNGEVFALKRSGEAFVKRYNFWLNRRISHYLERTMGSMASGANIGSRFNQGLIRLLCRYGPKMFGSSAVSPETLAIPGAPGSSPLKPLAVPAAGAATTHLH